MSAFIKENGIKTRGVDVLNVLEAYKDTQNLFYENYTALASRDLNSLKEVGIRVKESELGIKFEEVTKAMFEDLGFKVDEALRKQVNTKRDKMTFLFPWMTVRFCLSSARRLRTATTTSFRPSPAS